MPDDRPQYEGYKRPSPVTCLVGVFVSFLIVMGVYLFIFLIFPEMRARLTYPLIAVLVIIGVAGGIYYLATNRRRSTEHAAQDVQRAASDDWVAKELAESPYKATDAGDAADKEQP